MSPLALAGICGGFAFIIVGIVGSSIESDGGRTPWLKTALGVGFAIFLLVLGLILMPGK